MNQSNNQGKHWETTFQALDTIDNINRFTNESHPIQADKIALELLSEEQVTRCQILFKQFDKDGNNKLSVSEIGEVLQAVGYTYSENRLQDAIDLITGLPNSDGLNFQEFAALMRLDLMDEPEKRLRDRFRQFDTDGSGTINRQELRVCLGNINRLITNEELEAMLQQADTDGDGQISYNEFYKLFQQVENQRRFNSTSMPDRDWWEKLFPYPEETLKLAGLKENMSVLDIGCGYGMFTIPAALLVNPAPVVGIDIDGEILEQGRKQGEVIPNCSWIWGDIRSMSKSLKQKFDFILIHSTLHGIEDKIKLIHDVESVLNPGAYFSIVNWCPIPREETLWLGKPRGPKTEVRLTAEQVFSLIKESGVEFSFAGETPVPPYHYSLLFRYSGK